VKERLLADAEAVLQLDRTMRSRLFPVDAGLDPDVLRDRYPDRGRYVVLEGLIHPRVVHPVQGPPVLTADLRGPVIDQVHLPRDLARRLGAFLPRESWNDLWTRMQEEARRGWPQPRPPRYRTVLEVGRRYQPWVAAVTAIEPEQESERRGRPDAGR